MCGICGIISVKTIDNLELRMQKMMDSLYHRGPDAEGKVFFDRRIALGQRRLSIIDLDVRANQPMVSDNGNVISYNGEIYNYTEIKNQISYPFTTESDTEVVLAGIERQGIDWMLEQSNGMFAFAYFDKKSKTIYLARDRMGIKPLYYYLSDDEIVFASEIKAILHSGLVKAEFNEAAIDEYLGNRYVRAPYTFFKDIYQVMPGHYLKISDSCQIHDVSFWQLPTDFNMDTDYDEMAIEDEFDRRVQESVRRRMISDVPVGTYLSGGVDSSLITAMAALNHESGLNTYTIGFEELNEFTYAKEVSKQYNTNHHEILMSTKDYFDRMEQVIRYKDAPLGVPNEIPLAEMSEELKKSITVVLSGEGADELMGGYGRIYRAPFDYMNLGNNKENEFYDYFIELYEYVPRTLRNDFLTVDYPLRHEYDYVIRKDFACRSNEQNVFRFFHEYHVKGLLQRVDTTTMLASVEARVPFLDHTLIEYVYKQIPYDLKLRWKTSDAPNQIGCRSASEYSEEEDIPKFLLRQISYRYLPKDVIERKKMGFPVPLQEWFQLLASQAKELLKDAYWLQIDRLDELIESCKNQPRSGQLLWMFINIELFRKNYFLKNWVY